MLPALSVMPPSNEKCSSQVRILHRLLCRSTHVTLRLAQPMKAPSSITSLPLDLHEHLMYFSGSQI